MQGMGLGICSGKIVTILGSWMGANRQLNFRIKLPNGDETIVAANEVIQDQEVVKKFAAKISN